MNELVDQSVLSPPEKTSLMLHELGISIHRLGYRQLCAAIPRYARNNSQSITKELYPTLARQFGNSDWHPVERSIRSVIHDAWSRRDPEVWSKYFTNLKEPPSNKEFIATLAEHL